MILGVALDNIHSIQKNANFIIHEACILPGLPTNSIESMSFCISFLARNGEPNEGTKRNWITGDIMASLVSHLNRKMKFVFDETIVHKEGWSTRDVLSQTLSQTFPTDEYFDYGNHGPIAM